MKDKIWYLSNHNLFQGMIEEDFSDVVHVTQEYTVDKYKPIFLPGDPVKNIYFIKNGKVKISSISEDGKQLTMAILGNQDIFGELSLIGQKKQTTIAEAIENTYLCYIKKEDFESLLKKSPILSFKITKQIGLKLQNIENRIENIVFLDTMTRLVTLLLDLSKKYGIETKYGIEISLPLTHEEIGQLIAVNRQTVTTKLNELKQKELIDIKRSQIIIKDINKLESISKHAVF
ncbi:MAG: Crp/Fnr family transcriptional regulator [Cyanobacteriota bacterium]